MTEFSYPFDAGAGATVGEVEWQRMAREWLRTGVIDGRLNRLAVSADGSVLGVNVASGSAWIEGHFYLSDAVKALPIGTADPTNPRIDTIVARLDRATDGITTVVRPGTPAVSPVPPTLTQTDALYELPLADVRVDAAAGVIAAGKVTDRRTFTAPFDRLAYQTVIAETVLGASAASITFAAIPQTFRHLRLIVTARSDVAATNADLLLRINGNTGANYSRQRLFASGTSVGADEAVGQSFGTVGIIPAASATAGKFGTLDVVLPDYTSTTRHKTAHSRGGSVAVNAAGGLSVREHLVGFDGIDAITSLTLLLGSGNLVAGTVATLIGQKGV